MVEASQWCLGQLSAPKRAVDQRVKRIVALLIILISLTMPLAKTLRLRHLDS
ncbi:hypothetical protein OVA29_19565 [Exiguobacterium sp. SL14]|nr:hypothetical protein [Exiguobacterium sp. SL14]MCY1692469.1 hypothetical protein [Exiguobacterium sp. SL14]